MTQGVRTMTPKIRTIDARVTLLFTSCAQGTMTLCCRLDFL